MVSFTLLPMINFLIKNIKEPEILEMALNSWKAIL